MKKSNKNHYVDNNKFLESMIEYKRACLEAEDSGEKKPQIPDYVARCILMIAEKLSSKPNFHSYTFREEMVGDGIKNCIMYIDNFDPEKSSNPFAYFTQIIYYAFIQRINRERKQLYIKYKSSQEVALMGEYELQEDFSNEDHRPNQVELYENINEFVENYEQKNNLKRKEVERHISTKKSGIETLFEDD
jgi:DNA-directed RNA polymerase specialized sigma24 family protein